MARSFSVRNKDVCTALLMRVDPDDISSKTCYDPGRPRDVEPLW